MATDLLTGKPIAEAEMNDPLSYQAEFTDGKSDTDPQEKTDAVWEKALETKNMPGDEAWKHEETRASSAWDAGMDFLVRGIKTIDDEFKESFKTASGIKQPGVVGKDISEDAGDEYSRYIFETYPDRNLIPGVPYKMTEAAGLPQMIAFSATSMFGGLATAAPFVGVPIPGARAIPMLLGSGYAAWNMARYEFMQGLLEEKNAEEPLTPETEKYWKEYYKDAANRYAWWEAFPEAISNVAFVGILTGKMVGIVGKPIAKKVGARLTAKFGPGAVKAGGKVAGGMLNVAAMFGEEIATESWTQFKQARIEEEVGIREPGKGQISYLEAVKEVAASTIALTMIMGGMGASGVAIAKAAHKRFAQESKGKDPEKVAKGKEGLDKMINEVNKQVIEKERQKKLINEDSMKGLIGWTDEEGNYHSALEDQPVPDEYIGKGETKDEILEDIGKGRYVDPEKIKAAGIDPNKYILNDKETLAAAEKERPAAIERQKELDTIVDEVINEVEGASHLPLREDGTETPVDVRAKSATSMALKVSRKKADGKSSYTLDEVSDHARNSIILDSFQKVKDVIKSISKKGMWTIESKLVEPHASGYKGIFLKSNNGQEIQLHTKGSWALKLKTDEFYRDFRVMNYKNMTSAEMGEFQKILNKTRKLYQGFYDSAVKGSLSELESAISALALSSGIAVESSASATEKDARTSLPAEGEKTKPLSTSTKKPDSVSPNIASTPSDKKVAPEKPKVKQYPEVTRRAIDRIKNYQERSKDKKTDMEKEKQSLVNYLNQLRALPAYLRGRMAEAVNNISSISTDAGRGRFSKFLDSVVYQIELAQQKQDLMENINKRQLKRVDNLRKAAKLPPIKNMTGKQLEAFTKMLEPYQEGDIFLTKRQIETVDNTDLSGIRTRREAQERLAKEAGVSVNELSTISVSWADKFRQDERLRHRNPIFKLLVEGFHAVMIKQDLSHRAFERENNALAIKARKSRKRGLGQRLIPTDELVFNYLSSRNKTEIAAEMTKEELAWALFLQEKYAKALEYLIQQQVLKTGLENYITNLRRGFLEGLAKGGIMPAIREMFDAHRQDQQSFNILDGDTGMILPLEKFFQFSMKRTGGIKPTKNVAKASEIYFQTLYKKIALDAIIPKMMVYVSSITPLKTTPRGLEFDRSIEKFVKTWINAKKGRKAQHFIPQGGSLDIGILTLKSLIMLWDLGLNIPIQIAATGGELTAGYATLGKKRYAQGAARFATPKGRSFVEKFEGFVGKTLWQELLEPSKHIGDKFGTLLMGGFASSSTRMNKISLLGMITKEEYDSGNVSPERLAQIKLDIGKMRVIAGGKSIWESTTGGGLWTQYKTWALPILATNVSDSITNTKRLAEWSRNILIDFAKFDIKGFGDRLNEMGEVQKTEEMTRLRREVEILAAAALVFGFITVDEDDRSFTGQLLFKVRREIFTILGALDIKMWLAAPRLVAWLAQMAQGVSMFLAGEKYKSEGRENELKGLTRLQQMATPRALSMNESDKKEVGGIF